MRPSKSKDTGKSFPLHPKVSQENGTSENVLHGRFLTALFAIGLIVAFFLRSCTLFDNESQNSAQGASDVPIWQWEPSRSFALEATQHGRPVIIRNSIVTSWRASSKWKDMSYLQKRIGAPLTKVYRNSHRFFGPYFDATRPLAAPLSLSPPNAYEMNVSMSFNIFAKHMRASARSTVSTTSSNTGTADPYLYYSGELDRFGEWAFEDISPFAELLLPMPERSSVNVWMGQKGVVAHCHCTYCVNTF